MAQQNLSKKYFTIQRRCSTRWEISVLGEDATGEIDILLLDREIRNVFNLAVIDFDEEV